MGQEIATTHFKHYDFHRFDRLFAREMELLHEWFRQALFSRRRSIAGLELEAWLVDESGQPTPWNAQVIAESGSADVVPELSRFNVAPQALAGRGIEALTAGLGDTWRQAQQAADRLGSSVVAIGILPTITDPLLSLANMSPLHRYQALNEQVLRLRQGRPIRLQISGRETLAVEHRDVMLEAATTSFQLHLQTPLDGAVRYYNAALCASAVTVAVAANAPLLFGKLLWEETRIPLFEQAIDVGGGPLGRVTFGSGYAHDSLEEVFCENQARYPVLLPLVMDEMSARLAHVRLLNGTIWRWNRPLIGFDDDETPHLRIEHRVMSAGPTLCDMTANLALFYGLVESLAHDDPPPETRLPFADARDNFYLAAQRGLDCTVRWLDGGERRLAELVLDELLPRAAEGLGRLAVDRQLAARWLGIVEARVRQGQTGAVWQRRFIERHGRDLAALTREYRARQQRDEPVHQWSLERAAPPAVPRPRSMLQVISDLPEGLLDALPSDLASRLGRPTLIHLAGRRPEPLFVSIVLHGNEPVGLAAVQAVLRRYGDAPLPRACSILVGNVAAAHVGARRLPNQPDYNRVWPGAADDGTPEHALMRHVVAEMRARGVFASVDLHNNTGLNPHYACVTCLDDSHLQLAALFSRTVVHFQRPLGVQARAMAELCPAITCECGKVGDEAGVQHAAEFLEACLRLNEVPSKVPADGDLHLFHTVATVEVAAHTDFCFGESAVAADLPAADLVLRADLERLNFQELSDGTCLGWTRRSSPLPLFATDDAGRNVTTDFLQAAAGRILLRREAIPAMLTCDQAVIRQDCLGYLMQRVTRQSPPLASASGTPG